MASKAEKWGLGAFFVISVLLLLLHGNQLVDHIPVVFSIISGVAGFAFGAFIAAKMASKGADRLAELGVRGYLGLLAMPVFFALAGTYYCRLAFEIAAFSFTSPISSTLVATVEGVGRGKLGGPWAYVQPSMNSRKLQIKITTSLYERLDPYRNPGRDCMILSVQTGRFDVRRAVLPAVFENGLDIGSLTQCADIPQK